MAVLEVAKCPWAYTLAASRSVHRIRNTKDECLRLCSMWCQRRDTWIYGVKPVGDLPQKMPTHPFESLKIRYGDPPFLERRRVLQKNRNPSTSKDADREDSSSAIASFPDPDFGDPDASEVAASTNPYFYPDPDL